MKVPRVVRAVIILGLLIASCSGLTLGVAPQTAAAWSQDEGEPVQGGTLRLVIGEEPDQLDPARTIELTASDVMQVVYDRLVYIDEEGLPQPWIAESWEISDDGRAITFKIREGIKFHDGTDLDANAVKFTYDRILDPEMAAPYKSFMEALESVDAPDATTAVFNFSEPYAPFFTNSTIIGIVSPAAVEQFGDDFGHNPVGSGPFMFREWQPGTKIIFDRFTDYVNYRGDDANEGPAYAIPWSSTSSARRRPAPPPSRPGSSMSSTSRSRTSSGLLPCPESPSSRRRPPTTSISSSSQTARRSTASPSARRSTTP